MHDKILNMLTKVCKNGRKYGNCGLHNKASSCECFCLRFEQCFLWLYSRYFARRDVFSHNGSLDALPLPCPHPPHPSPSLCLTVGQYHQFIHSQHSTLIWNKLSADVRTSVWPVRPIVVFYDWNYVVIYDSSQSSKPVLGQIQLLMWCLFI